MNDRFFHFLGLREDPFHVSPDPRFYYSTPGHEAALVELLFGIETRQGFLVLTGEAGTGKTSLLNQIMDWLRRRGRSTAYIFHTHLEPIGLLRFILSDFGLPCQTRSKSELVKTLHRWLLERNAAGDLPVLILDEAQAIPTHTLDELRLLLNLETPRGKLLQIILSGQPELDEKLRLPELRQLRQRIMFHSRLSLLTPHETAAYISNRLAVAGCSDSSLFPDQVIQDIYRSSRGIPRVVNLLCEHALISAYSERQRAVSPEMVRRIAVDFDLLAKPLAVTAAEPQTDYAGFARFPAMDEAVPRTTSSQRLTSCGWEQIDFNVFKQPYTAEHEKAKLAHGESGAPIAVSVTQIADAEPVAPAVPVPSTSRSGEMRRYWRSKGSASRVHSVTSAIGVFTQRCRAAMQSVSRRVREALVATREHLRDALVSAGKALRRPPASIEPDVEKRPVAAARPAMSTEPKKYWRRSRSAAALFARNSAVSGNRAWHGFVDPFGNYLRSVGRSFVRDCGSLFRGLTPALLVSAPGRGSNGKAANRTVLGPLKNWLKQPVTPRNIFNNRPSANSNHRKAG